MVNKFGLKFLQNVICFYDVITQQVANYKLLS